MSTGSNAGEVNMRLEATDGIGNASAVTVFEGTWLLVEESGGWRLDSASIAVVSP